MTHEEFNVHVEAMRAKYTDDQILYPHGKDEMIIQSFRRIALQAEKDRAELEMKGLATTVLQSIGTAIDGYEHAQHNWNINVEDRKRASDEWKEESVEGFELQRLLAHDFTFAYRKNADLMKRIEIIKRGGSGSDMIQDLGDYSELGRANPEYLEAIQFDMTLLDRAEALNNSLSTILAENELGKLQTNDSLYIRNLCYTEAKALITEIKEYADYIFWKDEDKLKSYLLS